MGIRALYGVIIYVIDTALITFSRLRINSLTNKRRLLLIKLDQLGDFLAWLPVAASIRAHFDTYEITLLANPSWGDWAAQLPYWDRVISADYHILRSSLLERWRVFRSIAILDTDIALSFDRQIAVHDCVIRINGASHRYGPSGDERRDGRARILAVSDRWFNHLIDVPGRRGGSVHSINDRIAAELGIVVDKPGNLIPETAVEQPQSELLDHAYIVISPFSNAAIRDWPLDRFVHVAKHLSEKYGVLAVFTGTQAHAQAISQALDSSRSWNAINLAGTTSLPQLAGVIRNAKLILSNESGPIHLAHALNVPSVCVLGGGHFGQLLPYPVNHADDVRRHRVVWRKMECFHCDWKCKFEATIDPAPCVREITEEDVQVACDELISHANS